MFSEKLSAHGTKRFGKTWRNCSLKYRRAKRLSRARSNEAMEARLPSEVTIWAAGVKGEPTGALT